MDSLTSNNKQMKIPNDLSSLAYKLSKQVFEEKLTVKEGQQQLVGNNRMNPSSALDYIRIFRSLQEGKVFKRTLSASSMEYYLNNINKDYGSPILSKALTALINHIEYYESCHEGKMHKMRNIHAKYLAISIDTPDEQEQIVRVFKNQNKTKQEIITELKDLKPTDPEVVIINSKSFKRDNRTIAQIKILRDFKCQICSTTIKKKDGTFYIEAAHIKPKHQKGCETPDNILLLCPNHHKEFDFGELDISLHDREKVHFTLNGAEHKISLIID